MATKERMGKDEEMVTKRLRLGNTRGWKKERKKGRAMGRMIMGIRNQLVGKKEIREGKEGG